MQSDRVELYDFKLNMKCQLDQNMSDLKTLRANKSKLNLDEKSWGRFNCLCWKNKYAVVLLLLRYIEKWILYCRILNAAFSERFSWQSWDYLKLRETQIRPNRIIYSAQSEPVICPRHNFYISIRIHPTQMCTWIVARRGKAPVALLSRGKK